MSVLPTVMTFPLAPPSTPRTRCHLIWNSYALNTENEVDMGTAGQNEHYKCYSSVSSSVTPSEELMSLSWHLLFGWWCQQTSPVITSFIMLCIDGKSSLQKGHRLLFLLKTWKTNLAGIKLCLGIFFFFVVLHRDDGGSFNFTLFCICLLHNYKTQFTHR